MHKRGSLADLAQHHADRILRASGSAFGNYEMPATREAILSAVREAMAEDPAAIGECICSKCGIRHGGSNTDGGF